VIRTEVPGHPGLVVFGVVRGLVLEAEALRGALQQMRPQVIGLGVSAEESRSLTDHFVDQAAEPLVPLLSTEAVEIRELGRYGEVRVPNPSFVTAIEWAGTHAVRVAPVDPSEEEYANMFGDTIGYLELVRRTLRERRLLRSPPRGENADDFVLRWDADLNRGRESRRLVEQREAQTARELERLARESPPTAAVVDRERVPRLLRTLQGPSAGT